MREESDILNIYINKSDVTKTGSQIYECYEEFEQYIKKFTAIIESINTAWEGSDSLKYIDVMKEKYIVELEKISDILKEHGKYLKNIPEAYTIIDNNFKNKKIDV